MKGTTKACLTDFLQTASKSQKNKFSHRLSVGPNTLAEWAKGTQQPIGVRQIFVRIILTLKGYKLTDFNIAPELFDIGLLVYNKKLDIESVASVLGYTSSKGLLAVYRGDNGIANDKRELARMLCEDHRDTLAELKSRHQIANEIMAQESADENPVIDLPMSPPATHSTIVNSDEKTTDINIDQIIDLLKAYKTIEVLLYPNLTKIIESDDAEELRSKIREALGGAKDVFHFSSKHYTFQQLLNSLCNEFARSQNA